MTGAKREVKMKWNNTSIHIRTRTLDVHFSLVPVQCTVVPTTWSAGQRTAERSKRDFLIYCGTHSTNASTGLPTTQTPKFRLTVQCMQ
jgi:hypothetical protein